MADKIAIIRIRGSSGMRRGIKDTLNMLNLFKKNFCAVVDKNPSNIGMIKKVESYITWGEIDAVVYDELIKKKGKEFKGRLTDKKGKIQYKKFIMFNDKKYKKFFRLNPPKGGFERKGIKVPFSVGGALGYRKEKINGLIKKMM